MPQVFGHRPHTGRFHARHDDDKLLTPKPVQAIVSPGIALDQPRAIHQHLITDGMAVAVVYPLEHIQIEDDQRVIHLTACELRNGRGHILFHCPAVLDPCQRIVCGEHFQAPTLVRCPLCKDVGATADHNAGSDERQHLLL
tara:strand:+ start:57161 stop:57583 length:423 start_codon:yes stop_codon:yes gene_type:complete